MVFSIMCGEIQWCFGRKWLWIERDIRYYKFKTWYVQNLGFNDDNPPNGDLIQHVCSFNGKLQYDYVDSYMYDPVDSTRFAY